MAIGAGSSWRRSMNATRPGPQGDAQKSSGGQRPATNEPEVLESVRSRLTFAMLPFAQETTMSPEWTEFWQAIGAIAFLLGTLEFVRRMHQ